MNVAFYPAASIATIVMILLTCLYIPSATSTILKYRCGVLPSLGSPYFIKYRMAVDTVSLLETLLSALQLLLTSFFSFLRRHT